MATLKDIAAKTGFSISTVSIVMRNQGNERNIGAETQEKIREAARQLGYQSNVEARILKSGVSRRMTVTVFWAADIRLHMLSRFINGLQASLLKTNYPCELHIKPYINNRLHEVLTYQSMQMSNGMIICNASEKDMDFLNNLQPPLPIVLYNRYSPQFYTVNINDQKMGTMPAEMFYKHGKKHPALLKAPATFPGMNIRTESFEAETIKAEMQPLISITVNDSIRGGYLGAQRICDLSPLPDCLFCTSDVIAFGALKAFHQKNIRIPEDIEIISVGNSDSDTEEYSIPSLSVVYLPMEQMAAACLNKLYYFMTSLHYAPGNEEIPISYIARESCPEG